MCGVVLGAGLSPLLVSVCRSDAAWFLQRRMRGFWGLVCGSDGEGFWVEVVAHIGCTGQSGNRLASVICLVPLILA